MTTHILRRWGAILLAGGLCLTVAYIFYPATARSSLTRPVASLGLLGIVLALTGLVGYQRGQSARATVNGWVGVTLVCLALAMLEIPHLVLGAFSPSSLYDLDAYHAGVWGQLEFAGLVLLPIGMVVLATATWRSGTYPRWAAWTLLANIVVAVVASFVEPLNTALHVPAPNYLLMSLSGLAMVVVARGQGATGSRPAARAGRPDRATPATL